MHRHIHFKGISNLFFEIKGMDQTMSKCPQPFPTRFVFLQELISSKKLSLAVRRTHFDILAIAIQTVLFLFWVLSFFTNIFKLLVIIITLRSAARGIPCNVEWEGLLLTLCWTVMMLSAVAAVLVVVLCGVGVQPGNTAAEENPLRLIRHERAATLIGK